ncbi:MAG: hypothetical protein FJ147_20245 [Deltaproteobacteria bacterium]|nr:hypothetical protein [Deltaproteobacteria bacterium]
MTETTRSSTSTDVPCFLVDRMLGRLAKWLRILGYDTVYLPQLSPQGLMREGRRQSRIILTRDTRVLRQKDAPPFVFIQADRFRDQIKQVIATCHLDSLTRLFTRCGECNELLTTVKKEAVREQVPEYVWQTQAEFHQCPGCHRIYWGATHKEHVIAELQQLGLFAESSRI